MYASRAGGRCIDYNGRLAGRAATTEAKHAMKYWRLILAATTAWMAAARATASEPNENFASATVLPAGVMSVADVLTSTPPDEPDTLLGIRNSIGQITFVDDDSSPFGNALASAAENVPTNSG